MMEGALSGKTGFTGNAGYCYVGALERDNRTFVVALLACGWPNNRSYKWSDTKEMINYGLENYTYHSFDEVNIDESKIKPMEVLGGQTNHIGETASANLKVVEGKGDNKDKQKASGVLLKEGEKIEIIYQMKKELEAPVKKGDFVGAIKYSIDGEIWKVKNIVVEDSIEKIDFYWCFNQIMKLYYI
jgi:D-alanyl-D-alanine carboxypeptidase (penicillin-binding protein 5/6)